ncbi:MAG: T9SS type A sorting domain-containing protein [Flavobacteriales bacterium]
MSFESKGVVWYVNDNSTSGDIYCSAAGSDVTGTGSSSAPYQTVTYVINNKTLGANDIVYIDAGTYNERWLINSNADGGTSGNPLSFIGAGITLSKNIVTSAVEAVSIGNGSGTGNSYITIKNMYFETQNSGSNTAYVGTNTTNIIFHTCSFKTVSAVSAMFYQSDNCRVMSCTVNTSGNGLEIYFGSGHIFDGNTITMTSKATGNRQGIFLTGTGSGTDVANNNTISSNKISGGNYGLDIQQQGTGNVWQNNFIWDCDYGIFADNGGLTHGANTFKFNSIRADKYCIRGDFQSWTIKNNIFYLAGGAGYYCVFMNDASNDPTTLNYNLYYYPTAGGQAAYRNGTSYATLASWKNVFNSDEANGITGNPNYSSSTNLEITAGSAAIDAANSDATVTDDVRRNPSYVRAAANQDIGAFEYNNAVLPVELVDFSAYYDPAGNIVNWTTASEINNDYFVLESSLDGSTFLPVYYTKGAGNSMALLHYSFTDQLYKNTAVVYYRLKQSDYDGTTSYSAIVAVEMKSGQSAFLIYPNPSNGKNISIIFSSPAFEQPASLMIFDAAGKMLMEQQIVFTASSHVLNLAQELPTGIYFITLQTTDQSHSKKLFVE